MDALLATMPPDLAAQRTFLATYRRTTLAVGEQIAQGRFEDPDWVDRWDVVFADLYLGALEARARGQPRCRGRGGWPSTRRADLPPLRHVLLGINAHINYDLPQALLAVISPEDFADAVAAGPAAARPRADRRDPVRRGSRPRTPSSPRRRRCTILDRVLQPLNRAGLQAVPARGATEGLAQHRRAQRAPGSAEPRRMPTRLAELEVLSAAKIGDLLAPGQVLLRLAVAGFGVTLPPPA